MRDLGDGSVEGDWVGSLALWNGTCRCHLLAPRLQGMHMALISIGWFVLCRYLQLGPLKSLHPAPAPLHVLHLHNSI